MIVYIRSAIPVDETERDSVAFPAVGGAELLLRIFTRACAFHLFSVPIKSVTGLSLHRTDSIVHRCPVGSPTLVPFGVCPV